MENIQTKIWGGLALILLSTLSVQAQQNELGLALYGGLGNVKSEESKLTDGNNGGITLDYFYSLDANWSIGTGVNFGLYQLKITQQNYRESFFTTDIEAEEFEFRSKVGQFTETLTGNYLAIPLIVRYETSRLSDVNFYIQGGFQYRFNSKVKSKMEIEQLQTSGYFSSLDAELFEPEFMGFGKLERIDQERKLQLKNNFSLLGEVGVKQGFANNRALYLGLYIDCNLSSKPSDQSPLVGYQTEGPTRLEFHSRLERKNEDRARLRMLAVGLKLRYAFGI